MRSYESRQQNGLLLTRRDSVDAPEWWLSANDSEGEEESELRLMRAGIEIQNPSLTFTR
jgi:hypothetical protein